MSERKAEFHLPLKCSVGWCTSGGIVIHGRCCCVSLLASKRSNSARTAEPIEGECCGLQWKNTHTHTLPRDTGESGDGWCGSARTGVPAQPTDRPTSPTNSHSSPGLFFFFFFFFLFNHDTGRARVCCTCVNKMNDRIEKKKIISEN